MGNRSADSDTVKDIELLGATAAPCQVVPGLFDSGSTLMIKCELALYALGLR